MELAIYLMDVLGSFKVACGLLTAGCALLSGGFLLYRFLEMQDDLLPKPILWGLAASFLFLMLSVFTPSESTMKKIVAVNFLKENKEQIAELPIDIKDYVIDFVKELKGALQEDKKNEKK